ncbi:DUF7680 family protein [Caballeronia zhejiangensis]|uniref:DUF7680 family protein n=1 Tax=Caballeronia zhejiangensis TaxID=871203 RepID=UPI001EF6E6AF|nr:hypothetical protein [Caballeronia zhejiangensis]MCG7399701.1 hypothetical protein [Caballeronia zhejiangensis]
MATKASLQEHYDRQLKGLVKGAPFVLRITEWKDKPPPILVVKERVSRDEAAQSRGESLVERGFVKGETLRRLLPLVKKACSSVVDAAGVPTQVDRFLTQEGLRLRVTLPLDDEAGAKLALVFRLQERLPDAERVELLARRVLQFSREEALYWLSRITDFGPDANRWAVSGLRLFLGGQPNDTGVTRMLESLRSK